VRGRFWDYRPYPLSVCVFGLSLEVHILWPTPAHSVSEGCAKSQMFTGRRHLKVQGPKGHRHRPSDVTFCVWRWKADRHLPRREITQRRSTKMRM
jgi:hypothetical protein